MNAGSRHELCLLRNGITHWPQQQSPQTVAQPISKPCERGWRNMCLNKASTRHDSAAETGRVGQHEGRLSSRRFLHFEASSSNSMATTKVAPIVAAAEASLIPQLSRHDSVRADDFEKVDSIASTDTRRQLITKDGKEVEISWTEAEERWAVRKADLLFLPIFSVLFVWMAIGAQPHVGGRKPADVQDIRRPDKCFRSFDIHFPKGYWHHSRSSQHRHISAVARHCTLGNS